MICPLRLGILAASGQIDGARLAGHEFAGELSLSGELRPVRGALAMSLALHAGGVQTRLVLPPDSAKEAALVPDAQVFEARHLLDVVQYFLPANPDAPALEASAGWSRVTARTEMQTAHYPDMADVKGQPGATTRAGNCSRWRPQFVTQRAAWLGQVHAGAAVCRPVARHDDDASAAKRGRGVAWVGVLRWRTGASGPPAVRITPPARWPWWAAVRRPGPARFRWRTTVFCFLTRCPEFPRAALEALREPLESGFITISRAARRAEFPARFQLIGAMNPCPCGYLGSTQRACRCTPDQVSRYQGKLSGPLMDRIDLHVEVPSVQASELIACGAG